MPATTPTPQYLLGPLLREVSRSFNLTLSALPAAVSPQIGLAYLLARATDTVADTDALPLDQRLDALEQLRARIQGNHDAPLEFDTLVANQALPAERLLLERIEGILGCLAALDSDDRQRIREVLTVITSGQELDLRRFHGASVERIVALTTDAELDDYTYRVAGCVGEFWTKMCLAHLFRAAAVPEAEFLALAVRFGKGLQLVNILRDLPRDLCQGRCYVPQELLAVQRLDSTDLLKVETEARFRPVYNPLLNLAEAHLAAGWAYTNALPRGQYRLRLACAWPILIGARTLELLRTGNPLDSTRRIKVARAEVYQIILGSILRLPFAAKWQQQFRWAK